MIRGAYAAKAFAYIAAAVMVIMKAMGSRQKKRVTYEDTKFANDTKIEGEVKKVMPDGNQTLLNVITGSDSLWLCLEDAPPSVGERVEFRLGSKIHAYESKASGLAFEKVYLVKEFSKIS